MLGRLLSLALLPLLVVHHITTTFPLQHSIDLVPIPAPLLPILDTPHSPDWFTNPPPHCDTRSAGPIPPLALTGGQTRYLPLFRLSIPLSLPHHLRRSIPIPPRQAHTTRDSTKSSSSVPSPHLPLGTSRLRGRRRSRLSTIDIPSLSTPSRWRMRTTRVLTPANGPCRGI